MSNPKPGPAAAATEPGSATGASQQRTSRWHRADLLSLFFGIVFLAVVGWWAASYYLDWAIDWNLPNLGWFVAGALILLGLLGLLASVRSNPDRTPDLPPPPAAPGPTSTVPPAEVPTEVPLTVRTYEPTAPSDRLASSPEVPTAAEPGADRPE
jgi:hypothetical protein